MSRARRGQKFRCAVRIRDDGALQYARSGLTILPTHRVIRNLANFDFEKFRIAGEEILRLVRLSVCLATRERQASFAEFTHEMERQRSRHAIGVYAGGGAFYLFVLRKGLDIEQVLPKVSEAQRELDVVLLHKLMIEKCLGITAEAVVAEEHITYQRDMNEAIAAVDRGEAQLSLPAECRQGAGSDADCARRRRDAAEVHGFLSQAAEWFGDLQSR